MSMTPRVARLRRQSLEARPVLSPERAMLVTAFYQQDLGPVSAPLRRALLFQYLLEHKAVYIGEGELLVGEKGPAPKAAPTYPELCCHTLEDLEILDSREKIPFAVSDETRRLYAETVIPFWRGKSLREIIFREMTPAWREAYEAGVFTEFMEQRSPGHTVLDGKIYSQGMVDFIARLDESLAGLDFFNDPLAYDKQEELRAMRLCAQALIRYAERHAARAQELAALEPDPQRQAELRRIA